MRSENYILQQPQVPIPFSEGNYMSQTKRRYILFNNLIQKTYVYYTSHPYTYESNIIKAAQSINYLINHNHGNNH